jgi:hypothetical protein
MSFENPSSQEAPKTLLDALKQEIADAEADLKSHYKKGGGAEAMDVYKEGKEKSADLLALRKGAKALEAADGDVEQALADLDGQKDASSNPDVVERAKTVLERKSQAN